MYALPTSPYPGLRPFQDADAMLMYGRDQQINEIRVRLGRPVEDIQPNRPNISLTTNPPALTRFVAVLGGSGSGKSSLVRAGVIPSLREKGLTGVSDLWLPLTFTPGTNFGNNAMTDGAESPITRLARNFEALLKPLPPPALAGASDAAAADVRTRRQDIEALLRRPGGLDRIVEVYDDQFDLPESVRGIKPCILIVIDQFEELFHWSNQSLADATALIERVIDHYHEARHRSGSPQCFVAITMRSEYLNDCAKHLGLPDAINAGSYLVGGLDELQLREAIERPAARFLRLRQRMKTGAADVSAAEQQLPRQISFDKRVVDRLLHDTLAIARADDVGMRRSVLPSDHLPLLQHALARTWAAACRREQLPLANGVPERIDLADLWYAADPAGGAQALEANLLLNSLQNCAEYSYKAFAIETQQWLEAVLPHLAYFDPVTNSYTQQRLNLQKLGIAPSEVRCRLSDDWLSGISYFHLDDDELSDLKLKVSHESFIRGWARFRQIIDREAARFEEFIAVMRRCSQWHQQKVERLLLEEAEIERLDHAALGPVIADSMQRNEWLATLRLYRDNAQPLVSGEILARFVQDSRARLERTAKAAARARRTKALGIAASGFLALALLVVVHGWWVRDPAMTVAMKYIQADRERTRRDVSNGSPVAEAEADELRSLRKAAALVIKARELSWDSQSPVHWLGRHASLLVDEQIQLMESASKESEVNEDLRQLLGTALWLGMTRQRIDRPLPSKWLEGRKCSMPTPLSVAMQPSSPTDSSDVDGQLLEGPGGGIGLFVPQPQPGADLVVYQARLAPNSFCEVMEPVFVQKQQGNTSLIFEASGLVIGVLSHSGNRVNIGGVADERQLRLYDVDWIWNTATNEQVARLTLRRLIHRSALSTMLDATTASAPLIATWSIPGGIEVQTGEKPRWLLSTSALPMVTATLGGSANWRKLEPVRSPISADSDANSRCKLLSLGVAQVLQGAYDAGAAAVVSSAMPSTPGIGSDSAGRRATGTNAWTDAKDQLCFVMQTIDLRRALSDSPQLPTEELRVNVYHDAAINAAQMRGGHIAREVAPAVSWRFTRQLPGSVSDWWVGTKAPWIGWLAAVPADAAKSADSWPHPNASVSVAPFSTEALMNIADQILGHYQQPASGVMPTGAAGIVGRP